MEQFNWIETIKWNIVILKITGLWPKGDGTYQFDIYFIYRVFCTTLFQYCYISGQIINLFFLLNDLEAATGSIFLLLTEIVIMFKSYMMIKNMKRLKQLMITLQSDMFQPKTPNQTDLVQVNLNSWKLITYTFWLICPFWFFFWVSAPILDKSFKEFRLPAYSWYPFEVKTSPQYEITYLHQSISMAYNVAVQAGTDCLIAALNMYIGAQVDILCDNLRNLSNQESDVSKKLLRCIHHHKEIVKFADQANEFYNWVLLGAFASGGVSISLALFQLTVVVPFSGKFFSFIWYAGGFIVELFLHCWFGNEIQVKSTRLLYAVFESDWTGLSMEVKNNLVTFSLRLQKPLQVFALDLFSLSLDTYMKILKTAYSYFTLLRNVNSSKL